MVGAAADHRAVDAHVGRDGEPWIDASQTAIYFASDRPGGAGGFDLYVARRTTSAVPFEAPERMTELSTAADGTDPWLAADQRTIYFARGDVVMSLSGDQAATEIESVARARPAFAQADVPPSRLLTFS